MKRLKGSELGYRGKGAPDNKTIAGLQQEYLEKKLASGTVPPIVVAKYERWRQLRDNPYIGDPRSDLKIKAEIIKLWFELVPHLFFRLKDVDWDE